MDSALFVVRQMRLPSLTVPRLPLVVVPVIAGAAAVSALATSQLGGTPASSFAGAGVFLLGATVAEAFPVRIVGVAAGATSLATIFIVATAVVYSWQLATLVGLMTMLLVEARRRKPLVRVAYNSALYSLGGAAAGAIALVVPSHTDIGLASAGCVLPDRHRAAGGRRLGREQRAVRVGSSRVSRFDHDPVSSDGDHDGDSGRALGASAGSCAVARAADGGDRALSALELPRAAGDAPGAHRSAHRSRQLPPLPGAVAGGAGRGTSGFGPG